jgi:5,10-methylenetetrahydromethanopterin reductase
VQERVPLIFGAMRGPKSFQAAGELSDGCHHALSYSKEAYEYLVENLKAGAERAGRDWKELDIGAWCVIVCAPDSDEAKRTARTMVAFYISSMPHEQLERHGIDPADMAPIVEALGKGELDTAFELTSPEVADKLSIAGNPQECLAKIKEIESAGVNHMILCITDPGIVKAFTGKDVSVPDVKGQLQLIHDEVMPAFA